MSSFPIVLKHLRTTAKMTQPELAQKLGVSRSAISMYELGSREPDFETLEAIADIFNVDMNTLISKEKAPTSEGEHEESLDKLAEIKNPDIRMIARAGKKMTPEQAENVRKYAQYMYPEAFEE